MNNFSYSVHSLIDWLINRAQYNDLVVYCAWFIIIIRVMIARSLLGRKVLEARIRTILQVTSQFTTTIDHNTMPAEVKVDLANRLAKMNLRSERSVIVHEESLDNGQLKRSKKKLIHKVLTAQQKAQLGLMIPCAPNFVPRMTKQTELSYREQLCQKLYEAQKSNLKTSLRILHMQKDQTNIDEYINSVYKDIFTRYAISRGFGIEWEAPNSRLGIINPASTQIGLESHKEIIQFYQWLMELLSWYPLERRSMLCLYSYSTKNSIPIDDVNVENIQKIACFFTFQLTSFGRFSDSFAVLKAKGQKVQLLVTVQDPIKLLNIEAICVQAGEKMLILQKYTGIEHNQELTYLIVSSHTFNEHEQYFKSSGYTKHSTFDSIHLLEMGIADQISLVPEIDGYHRNGALHIIDRFSGLSDFERASFHNLQLKSSYVNKNGSIKYQGKETGLFVTDLNLFAQILQPRFLKSIGITAKKFDIYSTFEDQVYSYKGEKLHFVETENYVLTIREGQTEALWKQINKSNLSQSKVVLERLKPSYPKPRDKRHHKKQIQKQSEQQTDYLSLKESLDIDELHMTTQSKQAQTLTMPIFYSVDQQGKQKVYANNSVLAILKQSLMLKQQDNSAEWNQQVIDKALLQFNSQISANLNQKIQYKTIVLHKDIIIAFKCLKNEAKISQLNNVVIEPQSKSEDILPFVFHLHFMIRKMANKSSQKGRRLKQSHQSTPIGQIYSLIKLHATIDQSQKRKSVDQILFGVLKSNNLQQHGYGLEALRLWIARHDSYLGDRQITDKDINQQIHLAAMVRKLYWEIMPLMNIQLTEAGKEMKISSGAITRQKLPYLHRFMLDHIDYYTLNMEECYARLDLSTALKLTEDFIANYVNQIFVKTVKKRMIAYPLHEQTQYHLVVLRRVLDLLAVMAPLLPYSAYHISRVSNMQWPSVEKSTVNFSLIPNYNRMTKLRVELRNKLRINCFAHSEVVVSQENLSTSNKQALPDAYNLTKEDLELFLDVQNVSMEEPTEYGRSFKLKLSQDHPVGSVPFLKLYEYKEVCVRCSPGRHYGTHICRKCLSYLYYSLSKAFPTH